MAEALLITQHYGVEKDLSVETKTLEKQIEKSVTSMQNTLNNFFQMTNKKTAVTSKNWIDMRDDFNGFFDDAKQKASVASKSWAEFQKVASGAGKAIHKTLAPVGKTIAGSLLAPLGLLKGAAQAAGKVFQSLFGAQLKALYTGIGNSILSAVGAMQSMRTAIGHVKEGFAQMISPLVQAVTPALAALTEGLATVLAYAGRLFAFLTGKTVKGADGAAAAVAGVGQAAQKTGRQAEDAVRSVMGFDELNRLDAPKDNTAGGGGGVGTAALPETETPWQASSPFLDSLLAAVQAGDYRQVGTLLGTRLNEALNTIDWAQIRATAQQWALKLTDMLNGFMAAPDMWATVGTTIGAGIDTALRFLSTAAQNFDWQAFGAGLAQALNDLVGAIDWVGAGQGVSAMVQGLLDAFIAFLQQTDWQAVGQSIADMLGAIDWVGLLGSVVTLICEALEALFELNGPLAFIAILVTGFTALAPLIMDAVTAFSVLGAVLSIDGPFLLIAAAISAVIAVLALLIAHIDDIKSAVLNMWETVCNTLSTVADWVQGNIVAPLGAAFQRLASTVGDIWEGIVNTIRGAVNGVIGAVNGLIRGVAGGLNGLIDGLNSVHFSVPSWVPGLGGISFGFALGHLAVPQIPALAQGAVLPPNREFLAVLGDQTRGTNVEAPLAVIEQAVANVLDDQLEAMMAGFEAVVAAIRDKQTDVVIGDDVIGRAAARYQQRLAVIRGGVV